MSKKVIVYSTPTCHFCHLAKDFLNEKGITFEEFNVATDLEKRKEMVERTGQMGVPVIVVDDEAFVGFDRSLISKMLGIE